MRRRLSIVIILCVLLVSMPALPAISTPGRAPDILSRFSDGRTSAVVQLEPRPTFNKTVTLTLPWNAYVSSARMDIGPADRTLARQSSLTALELSALPQENLTLSGQGLQLSRGAWNWSQEGAGLGANCTVEGGAVDGGFRLGHSNPPLSGSGGGVWPSRLPVVVSETGGLARTNETVRFGLSFAAGGCTNPQREVRVTDSSGAEQPVSVRGASYSSNSCTGAEIVFVVPALAASGSDTYYVYYGNPRATAPTFARTAYLAEPFTGPALARSWSVSNLDGLSYTASGSLRIQGTAISEFWQGINFETDLRFPGSFDLWFTLQPSAASGTGHLALVSVVQDDQNSIDFGVQYDSTVGQLSPAKFTLGRTVAGMPAVENSSAAGSPGAAHSFRLSCTAGRFSGYVDGALIGAVDSGISGQRLRLAAAARATGDSVDVAFDALAVTAGFDTVSVSDPAPTVQPGSPEQAGYNATATILSPLLENTALLPLGTARLSAEMPEGTDCTLSVLDPDNGTLASGLVNGQAVAIPPADLPAFRLRAELSTSDPGRTPLLRAWGLGDLWSGLDSPGVLAASQNITLASSGASLALDPARWNRSASAALGLGVASTFDDQGVAHPWVLKVDSGYRMYYAGFDGSRWRIGLATSVDGTTWTRYPENPLLVPSGGWESSHLDWPCVVWNGHAFEMWYAGSSDGGATFRIGHATSEDGYAWTRDPANPVLGPGSPGDWGASSVFAPRLRLESASYTMWYAGKNATATSIGMAASADGSSWVLPQNSPVLGPGTAAWSSQGVVPGTVQRLEDGSFRLWYSGFNSTFLGVGLAESPDGITWTARPLPLLGNGTVAAFDRSGAGFPSVLFDSGMMWYTASDGARQRIGLARACRSAEGSLLPARADLGTGPAALRMAAFASLPAGTNVTVQARTSSDGAAWSAWTAVGPSWAPVPAGRYLEWKASLRTSSNHSTPALASVSAEFEYHRGSGWVELPAVLLAPNEELASAEAVLSVNGGNATAFSSVDGGDTWRALEPGVPPGLNGTRLLLRAVVLGNHTSTPRLAGLSWTYSYSSFPSDGSLDAGADGTVDWSSPGVMRSGSAVTGLAGAFQAYLDARRGDAGDTRAIPLLLSSTTSCAVNLSGLSVEWSPRTFTNSPPSIESRPVDRARPNELYMYVVAGRDSDKRDRLAYTLEESPERMAISGTTGEITWQPYFEDTGYHTVRVSVSDGQESASQEYTLVVSQDAVNLPPTLSGSPPDSGRVGYEYSVAFKATDPDGDPVSFSLGRVSPAGASVDTLAGSLSWIPSAAQSGHNPLELLVSDGKDTVRLAFSVNVSAQAPNGLPAVTSTASASARAGLKYVYNISATDPDGDPLEYGLVSGPANATLSPAGSFSWTPLLSDVGSRDVVARISDGKGFVKYNFTVRVLGSNRAPLFVGPPDSLRVAAGRAWTYEARATDADGDALTYYLLRRPAGMSIIESTGALHWSPSPSTSGKHAVSVAATDGFSTAYLNFTLTVEGRTAPGGSLDRYGLAFTIIIVVILAFGGAAVILTGRRRRPGAAAQTEADTEPSGGEAQADGTQQAPDPGRPHIMAPSEGSPPAPSRESPLPPPEPVADLKTEPMKQVGAISRELQAAVDATNPPPSAMPELPPPAVPPPAPEPAIPGLAPDVAAPSALSSGPGHIAPTSRPVIAPPPAPTLTRHSPPVPAPSPAPSVIASTRPELYKPIPGPYDNKPEGREGAPSAAPRDLSPEPTPDRPGQSSPPLDSHPAAVDVTEAPPPHLSGKPGGPTGLTEDMDFISSFLSSREKARDEKIVESSSEWGMLKDFKKELETTHTAPRPAPAAKPAAPAAATDLKGGAKKADGSLTLDDILNELEG